MATSEGDYTGGIEARSDVTGMAILQQSDAASTVSAGKSRWVQWAVLASSAVGSALALTASLPPLDYGALAWVGLAPLLYSLRQVSARGAMWLSGLFGSLFGIFAFSWLRTLEDVNLTSYLLMVFAFCLYFLLFGRLYHRLHRSSPAWLLVTGPALWVALEFLRGHMAFLALPWNFVGHSQYRFQPVIQMTALTGVYGLSFVILLVNQVLSRVPEWVCERRTQVHAVPIWGDARIVRPIALVLLVVGSALLYGCVVMAEPQPDRHLRVALVQANVLSRDRMEPSAQLAHLHAYQSLTSEAAKHHPDLIVWPSSSLPGGMQSSRLVSFAIRRIATESGVFILAGGAGGEKFQPARDGLLNYSNSEFLISPAGGLLTQYNKMRLLPFNEYLPLQGYVVWPSWITTLQKSFEPGKDYTLFEVGGARFGAPICWENFFAEHVRLFVKAGAHFMVSATNEGFFGTSTAPYQTLMMNVFRAVENRVPVVRVSTTGISAFISRTGEIQDIVRDTEGHTVFVSGYLVRDIPLAIERTWYTLYGDVFAYLLLGLCAMSLASSFRVDRRGFSRHGSGG